MSTRTHPNPAGGRWAWREYLPTSIDEWLELSDRARALPEPGLDVSHFSSWMLAEMRGAPSPATSNGTLPKYRRMLYELAQTAPPPKRRRRRDAGLSDLRMAASVATGGAAGAVVAIGTGNVLLGAVAAVLDITGIPGDDADDELVAVQQRGSDGADVHTLRARSAGQGVLELHTVAA